MPAATSSFPKFLSSSSKNHTRAYANARAAGELMEEPPKLDKWFENYFSTSIAKVNSTSYQVIKCEIIEYNG